MGEHGAKAAGHLYKRDRIWWCWYYDHTGAIFRRSTGATDKKAAGARLAEWEQAAANPAAQEQLSLNDCLLALSDAREKTRPENQAFLTGKMQPLVTILGHELPIASIRDSTVAWRYIDARRRVREGKRPVHDRTIRRELAVLRSALAHAKSRGRWMGDPDIVVPPEFTVPPAPKGDKISRGEAERLFPHLAPDEAAAVAISLATGAELSALKRALKTDIPMDLEASSEILVRGTKNLRRHAPVPVVTDEQRVLLAYARKHAGGEGLKLFGNLHRLLKGLREACLKEGIKPVSPHDIRRSAGQWMVDLGVPLELVSKFMRHGDTRITETVYASVKQEDVADRILQAIDPRYAHAAHQRRKTPDVPTLKSIPEPKVSAPVYEVDGVRRTLAEWARHSGIAKPTLHHRVVTRGMTMAEAIRMGRPTYKKRGGSGGDGGGSGRMDCETFVQKRMETASPDGQDDPSGFDTVLRNPLELLDSPVRPDRFERTTFGFEVPQGEACKGHKDPQVRTLRETRCRTGAADQADRPAYDGSQTNRVGPRDGRRRRVRRSEAEVELAPRIERARRDRPEPRALRVVPF